MKSLAEPYRLVWKHRSLLLRSVSQTLRERFAGSVLGLGWLILGPVLLLSLYTILYTLIFQVRPLNMTPLDYILYIFSGLVPFIAFAQALGAGTSSLSANRALLMNRLFPAELIPVKEVLAAGAFLVAGGAIILAIRLVTGGISFAWLLLPLIVLLLAMATIGVVWAFALANLLSKDVQQIIGYITIMLLIASPIAYTPDMVPASLQLLLYLNPFAYYVLSFQSILVLGQAPPPAIIIGCFVFSVLSFNGMYRAFSTGKRIIADQI